MSVLERYPKTRPLLPPAYAAIHREHYISNRRGTTTASALSTWLEGWMHRRVARTPTRNRRTLELGPGTLNHLPYEPESAPYDIVEPFRELAEASPLLPRVRNFYADIRDIPAGQRYDRILSIAVLEHLTDLPEVVSRAGLLLSEDGKFLAAVPSEGTPLWRLGWTHYRRRIPAQARPRLPRRTRARARQYRGRDRSRPAPFLPRGPRPCAGHIARVVRVPVFRVPAPACHELRGVLRARGTSRCALIGTGLIHHHCWPTPG